MKFKMLFFLMFISFGVQSQNPARKIVKYVPACFSNKDIEIRQTKFLVYSHDQKGAVQVDTINHITGLDLNKGWFYVKAFYKSARSEKFGFNEYFKESDNTIRFVQNNGVAPQSTWYKVLPGVLDETMEKDTVVTFDPDDYSEVWKFIHYQKVVEVKK